MKSHTLTSRLFLIILVFLSACKADPKEMISRKWRPVDASGEKISSDVRKNIIKDGNILEFTQSGDFISYTVNDEPERGTYTLHIDEKIIELKRPNEDETQMIIKELHYRKLVLETNGVNIVFEPAK